MIAGEAPRGKSDSPIRSQLTLSVLSAVSFGLDLIGGSVTFWEVMGTVVVEAPVHAFL